MRYLTAALLLLQLAVTPPPAVDNGVIAGTVVDGDGVLLTGATVLLVVEKGGCPSAVQRTDVNGRFEFSRAQPGLYNLRAEKPGYLTQLFREHETGPHSFGRSIVLTPSGMKSDVEMVLPRAAATVSGTVYGQDGRPLPGGGWVFFED